MSSDLAIARDAPLFTSDPIFAISRETTHIGFDKFPVAEFRKCSKEYYWQVWIYASVVDSSKKYQILGGIFRVDAKRADIGATSINEWWDEDLNPQLFEFEGKSCHWISNMDFVFAGMNCDGCKLLRDELVMRLAEDSIRRAANAFGGQEAFIALLRKRFGSDRLSDYQVINETFQRMGWVTDLQTKK